MPRRREVPKREILPDPKYGNIELSKFMNVIMEGGKKAVAERIIYGALELIEKKHPDKDPQQAARKRGEKSMAQRLANELLEATEGRGGAMKKRDEVHRMAEANKAFSHFRF